MRMTTALCVVLNSFKISTLYSSVNLMLCKSLLIVNLSLTLRYKINDSYEHYS